MRYLLDVNVLIAVSFPWHAFHERAHSWFEKEPNRLWATCPLTQGGFLRIAPQLMASSASDVMSTALKVLQDGCNGPNHQFWPVDQDLCGLVESQRSRLRGPKQVADLQLLLLAHRHHGQLATFDTGIRELAGPRLASSLLIL